MLKQGTKIMSRRPGVPLATSSSRSRLDHVLAAGFAKLQVEKHSGEDTEVPPDREPIPGNRYQVTPTFPRSGSLADGRDLRDGSGRRAPDLEHIHDSMPICYEGGNRVRVPSWATTAPTMRQIIGNIPDNEAGQYNVAYQLARFIHLNTLPTPLMGALGMNEVALPERSNFFWRAVHLIDGTNFLYSGGRGLPQASAVQLQPYAGINNVYRKPVIMFVKEETWRDNLLDPRRANGEVLGREDSLTYFGEDPPVMTAQLTEALAKELPTMNDPRLNGLNFNLMVVVVGLRECRKQGGDYNNERQCMRKREYPRNGWDRTNSLNRPNHTGDPNAQPPDRETRTGQFRGRKDNGVTEDESTYEHMYMEFDDFTMSQMFYWLKNHTNGFQAVEPNNVGPTNDRLTVSSRDQRVIKEPRELGHWFKRFSLVSEGIRFRTHLFKITPRENRPAVLEAERVPKPGEGPTPSYQGGAGGKRKMG